VFFLQNSKCWLFSIIIKLFFYWKPRGIGPRSHGPGLWRLIGVVHEFIKTGPSTRWSTTQIKNAKGYPLDLILVIGLHVDGSGCVSFLSFVRPKQGTEAQWSPAWESSSYGAPFAMMFLPTWSMRREESNLPTYRGGNNRGKANDERAARATFNGGGDSVRRCSGSRDSSGSGGVGGGSSSKQRISAGGLDKVDQWRWMARRR
jgi:hypothetical protein